MGKNKTIIIKNISEYPCVDIALDTLEKKKQAIFFVNTKKSAEVLAARISKEINIKDKNKKKTLNEIKDKILNALSSPTSQCKKLANSVEKGAAFHHSGLHSKQREIIEDNFREGNIKFICSTPTLAFGVDLPAFRVIIRDLKRYTIRGMDYIPVLEYQQMAGRAGRPSYDNIGEAICIAKSKDKKTEIEENYINGEPEEIFSKLAVEPILRTYILSLIATGIVNDLDSIEEFFSKTFYAYQYKDLEELNRIIHNMLGLIEEWGFIEKKGKKDEFQNAYEIINKKTRFEATLLGKRVSQLYLDPYTAHEIIKAVEKLNKEEKTEPFSFLTIISNCLEIRPLLRVRSAERENIEEEFMKRIDEIIIDKPYSYGWEYSKFLNIINTALFFEDWLNEKDEEFLLKKYNARPGEIHYKLNIADWLLYSTYELTKILNYKKMLKEILKIKERMKYGVKEELLALLKLKGIGRVRARKLYNSKIHNIRDVKKAELKKLATIVGEKTALNIKKQVGQEYKKDNDKIKQTKIY